MLETLASNLSLFRCKDSAFLISLFCSDIQDLQWKLREYDKRKVYRQSKQANRMLSHALAGRLPAPITCNVCNPGAVQTGLVTDLGFRDGGPVENGAVTPIYLATSKEVEGVTGQYFEYNTKRKPCKFRRDKELIAKLVEYCEALTIAREDPSCEADTKQEQQEP